MSLIAPNPTFNTSVNEGHRLQGLIQAQRLGANPRLYGNDSGGQYFHPENSSIDNSDLPAWVMLSTAIADLNPAVGPDDPIYLQVWVAERQNFFDVAQVLRQVDGGGTLDQALK